MPYTTFDNISPRARRHYIPGYIWHITHRCHKKEFLLKFTKASYIANSGHKKVTLSDDNTYLWNVSDLN